MIGIGYGLAPGLTRGTGGVSFDFYVDSVNGSDSNDGLSADTAFASLGALSTAGVQSGDRIGLAKDSHWREQLTAYATGITVQSYGTGERPIIDGSRIIPAGSWTPDDTHANVYYADVTHEVATAPHATNANDSNTFHIAAWEDDTLLLGQFGGVDIAANRALVAATPGTFTAHLQGSTDADPRSGSGGTAYRYYVHLSDSGNPGSNGAVVAYAEQQGVALLATDGIYRGLEFRRTAGKDMVGMNSGLIHCQEVSDCVFRDPAVHGAVIRPALLKDCVAYSRADNRSKTVGGYGFNFYFGESVGSYTPAITAQNNTADGFATGIGSHGSGVILPIHDSVTLIDNSTPNCTTAINIGLTLNGLTVNGHTALNCVTGILVNEDTATISRFTYLSTTDGDCTAFNLRGDLLVENSSVVFRSSLKNRLASNEKAQNTNDPAYFATLTLNNVSNIGGTIADNDRRCQVHLRGSNSVLGKMSDVPNSRVWTSIEMSNSYLTERQRTIAEMVAAGNVLTACLSPWQLESIQRTVAASDVSITAIGRTGTSSGAGLSTLNTNGQDITVVNAVRAANWDGAGSNWDTYLLSVIASTGYNISTARPTPGAFTSKALSYLYYNKQFIFGYPLRQYHANATNNGPSWRVQDGDVDFSGVQASVLYHLNMSSPRYIGTTGALANSLSSSQVDAVNGVIDAGFDVASGATLTVSAVTDHSGEDLVWQGDPSMTGIAILDEASPLYALGMGRQA